MACSPARTRPPRRRRCSTVFRCKTPRSGPTAHAASIRPRTTPTPRPASSRNARSSRPCRCRSRWPTSCAATTPTARARPGDESCHKAYHYTDEAIQRSKYALGSAGTRDFDVVAAITAAIHVLKGEPAPPPFNIKDKREALLMLAHYVGDIHQPAARRLDLSRRRGPGGRPRCHGVRPGHRQPRRQRHHHPARGHQPAPRQPASVVGRRSRKARPGPRRRGVAEAGARGAGLEGRHGRLVGRLGHADAAARAWLLQGPDLQREASQPVDRRPCRMPTTAGWKR